MEGLSVPSKIDDIDRRTLCSLVIPDRTYDVESRPTDVFFPRRRQVSFFTKQQPLLYLPLFCVAFGYWSVVEED